MTTGSTVVVKVGTSSITSEQGEIDDASLLKLCQRARRRTRRRSRGRAGQLGRDRRRPARAGHGRRARPTSARCRRSPRSASRG